MLQVKLRGMMLTRLLLILISFSIFLNISIVSPNLNYHLQSSETRVQNHILEGAFLINEAQTVDGFAIEVSAVLHLTVSPNDIDQKITILIDCFGWWVENIQSSHNLGYVLKQPDDSEIYNGIILFDSPGTSFDFSPNFSGDWTVEFTFDEIIPVAHGMYAEIVVDATIRVEGLTSGVWIECRNSSSYMVTTSYELYLRNRADIASFWLLFQESGLFSFQINFFAPAGSEASVEKVVFSRYISEDTIKLEFSTISREGEIIYPVEISANQLGFWKMSLHYRGNHIGAAIALRIVTESNEKVHFYLLPEDGSPPIVDENYDGEPDWKSNLPNHILLIDNFDQLVPISYDGCAATRDLSTEIVHQGDASNVLTYSFTKSYAEWVEFQWWYNEFHLNLSILKEFSVWIYGNGDRLILFCYLNNEQLANGNFRSVRWDTVISHTGWQEFRMKVEEFVLDEVDYFTYSKVESIWLGVGDPPIAPINGSIYFDEFKAIFQSTDTEIFTQTIISSSDDTSKPSNVPTLSMITPGYEIAIFIIAFLLLAYWNNKKRVI